MQGKSERQGIAFCDCEADNLLYSATTIWCIVSKVDGQYHIYLKHQLEGISNKHTYYYTIEEYIEQVLSKVGHLVFHNGISYDLPLLAKLHNFKYNITPEAVTDTHILSRLYSPDREGHSLEWWGEKLRFKKGSHSDWTCLSLDMLNYCIQDVAVLERVYNVLQEEGKDWNWYEAIKLEYEIWDVQQKQETHGVLFDAAKAERLLDVIATEISEIEATVIEEIPMSYKPLGTIEKIFKKNGEYYENVLKWIKMEL